jgi:hypothetical protein
MRPLREQSERAARHVAEANVAFAPAPGDQAAAWARLQARWDSDEDVLHDPRVRRAGLGLFVGAGALTAMLWMVVRPEPAARDAATPSIARSITPSMLAQAPAPAAHRGARVGAAPEPGSSIAAAPAPHVGGAVDAEGPAPSVPLRPGRSLLAAGVRARLAPRGAATVRAGSGRYASVVSLQRGTLEIDIDAARVPSTRMPTVPAAGPVPARLQVQVAAYRLEPEPGRFSVSARAGRVEVVVQSGKLAVWSSRRLLATVVAGERWTDLSPATAPVPEGKPDQGRPAGQAGNGTGASAADVGARAAGVAGAVPADSPLALSPPAAARGPAVVEAPDCARLTRQGVIDEALACYAREAAQPGLVGELALIELARIRRDVRGDLAGAEQALAEHRRRFPQGALADEAAGSRVELLLRLGRAAEALAEAEHLAGGDAIFWRAVCFAKLGRRPEAARAFDDYLARPDGKRRAEAARMRAELAP